MKKTQKKQQAPKMPPRGVIIGVIILIVCLAAFWLTRNQSLYTPQKNEIHARAEKIMSAFNDESELVYSSLKDEGCTKGDVGWLGKTTQCVFKGDKYYKNNKNALADLQKTDKLLRKRGFVIAEGVALSIDYSRTFMYNSKDGTTVHIAFFKLDERNITAKDYLAIPTEIPLITKEYIYGIKVYAPYWSCSSASWFQQPCPSPPTRN